VVREFFEQFGPCACERQYGLVWVANGEQFGVGPVVEAHGTDEPVEAGCQVLVFVYVQARVAGSKHFADRCVAFHELDCDPHQLLEVDHPQPLKLVLVSAGDFGDLWSGAAPLFRGCQALPVDIDRGSHVPGIGIPSEHVLDGGLDDLALLLSLMNSGAAYCGSPRGAANGIRTCRRAKACTVPTNSVDRGATPRRSTRRRSSSAAAFVRVMHAAPCGSCTSVSRS